MIFTHADPVSLDLFSLFCLVMFSMVFLTLKKHHKLNFWFFVYVLLTLAACLLAALGITKSKPLVFIPAVFVTMVIFSICFATSKTGISLSKSLSLTALIGFQGFRLPLELILHHWATIGTVPSTMTWTGSNWDIVAGTLSIIAAPFVTRFKAIAWLTQSVSLILLLNVFRVVVMSSPLPFSWPLDNPLLLAANFPYVLIIPLFIVPALVGHILTFYKLSGETET